MRPSSFRTIVVLTLLPVVGLFIFLSWWLLRPAPSPEAPVVRSKIRAAAIPEKPKPKPKGEIVLIIDDVGFEGQQIERAMQLDPDISFSILPNGNRTADFARRLHERGFELLCHLPMEPMGGESPGANAILTSMTADEIARTVRANVASVPFAKGVNNHMGSRATADRRVMETVLRALPDGMYFIDSRTGGRSIAEDVARELKVPTAARSVFLDDERNTTSIRRQLDSLARAAAKQGQAIGIGHPHAATLEVLAAEMPRLREQGFRFVRASRAVN